MVNLNGLHPWVKESAKILKHWGFEIGVDPVIVSAYRTRAQQEELYRNPQGLPVARPGCSQHEYGYAFDMWATEVPHFERTTCRILAGYGAPCGPEIGQNWLDYGGTSLGLKKVPNDPPHFQTFDTGPFRAWLASYGLDC